MRNGVESGKHLTMADVGRLTNRGEQLFVSAALGKNSDLQIVYEPRFFRHNIGADGSQIGTVPDFWVINPRQPNRSGIFVEVTQTHKGPTVDPKARQRKAMALAVPKERYTVLYGENLDRIERKHPEAHIALNKNGHQKP